MFEDLQLCGYFFEFCINVEDFGMGFMLVFGIFIFWQLLYGFGVCMDEGYYFGMMVLGVFDFFIGKFIIIGDSCE